MSVLPPMPPESKLHSVVRSGLKKLGVRELTGTASCAAPWDQEFFGLQNSLIFQGTSQETRLQILRQCAQDVLEEALWIEDSGMSYTARMVRLARTEQEKVLYSLFSADEASHYIWMKEALNRLGVSPKNEVKGNPFTTFLAQTIESHPPEALVFLIQVFLEGWGIHRYSDMMHATQDPALRETLSAILQDEARHHGSGLVFNRESQLLKQLSVPQKAALVATLRTFLQMVRVGPQSTLKAIDEITGGLTRSQKIQTLRELNGVQHSMSRLTLLRDLLLQEKANDLVEELERTNSFTPLPLEECV